MDEKVRWRVRNLQVADHDGWRRLYAGYAAFYQLQQTEEQAETLWDWLTNHLHGVEGLGVTDSEGRSVGLAHFRAFARPSTATFGGYLDDLYVAPESRGRGASEALVHALRELASERGWSVVRWITADTNYRARGFYDRYAKQTSWVTYDLLPQALHSGARA